MSIADFLLLANAAATWWMLGVILFVQRVHYPLFPEYERGHFAATMAAHQRRTFAVVFPPMMAELATSLALLVWTPAGVPPWQVWLGAALVGVWGFSTALVQVPLHERLERNGWDAALAERLMRTNRLRTAAWGLRAGLTALMLAGRLSES